MPYFYCQRIYVGLGSKSHLEIKDDYDISFPNSQGRKEICVCVCVLVGS